MMTTTATTEIVAGLMQSASSIAPKYFYDAVGSALFEQITRLPQYYPTRVEQQIMQTHGAAMAGQIGVDANVIELGAGSCEKARALCTLLRPRRFVAVDISADFLQQGVAALRAACPDVEVHAVAADLAEPLNLPPELPRQRRLVFYPGSSIGNFDPPQALTLLTRVRTLLQDDGGLLIGVDLVKREEVLQAAYDDAQGITAAFNRNILRHVNRLISSDFEPAQWQHVAFYNSAQSRIEMHLQAKADVTVCWPGGRRRYRRGEHIHTENSYKYSVDGFVALLRAAGFAQVQYWCDAQAWFAVMLARPGAAICGNLR